VFQLVPGVSSSWCSGVKQAVWRHGYWHIARSQVRGSHLCHLGWRTLLKCNKTNHAWIHLICLRFYLIVKKHEATNEKCFFFPQIMHFKYDQNLEMHNGIHAAIRGKLLEATFAPVWVEPLECSVLGGGYGEPGSTTAQTFAISGISGPKAKRVKFNIGGSPQISMLLHACHKLYEDCDAFIKDFDKLMSKMGQEILKDSFFFNPATRIYVNLYLPKYRQLRLQENKLNGEIASFKRGKMNAQEIEAFKQVETAQKALAGKIYCGQPAGTPEQPCIDSWVTTMLLTCTLLPPEERCGQAAAHLISVSREELKLRSSAGPPVDRSGYMLDNIWTQDPWNESSIRVDYYARVGMFAAARCIQVADVGSLDPLPLTTGSVDYDVMDEFVAAFSSLVGGDEKECFQAAVQCMPVLALDKDLLQLKLSSLLVLISNVVGEIFQKMPNFLKSGTFSGALTTLDISASENKKPFVFFCKCVENATGRVHDLQNPGMKHMIGAYTGSMFAQAAIHRAYMGKSTGGFRDIEKSGWDTPAGMYPLKTRMAIALAASHMIDAGVAMASLLRIEDLEHPVRRYLLVGGLYLAYLDFASRMVAYYETLDSTPGPVLDTNVGPDANIKGRFDALQKFDAQIDKVCQTSLEVARRVLAGAVNDITTLKAAYTGISPWHTGKFDSKITGADYGLRDGELIALEILTSMKDSASNNQLFNVISKCITDLDEQTTVGHGTNTASSFEDGGEGSAGITFVSGRMDSDVAQGGSILSEDQTSSSNPVLGTILLDSSEQQLASSIRTAGPIAEDAEGTEAASSDVLSASPTGKTGKSGGKSGGSSGSGSTSKGQFRKVQAKLL